MACQHSPEDQTLLLQAGAGEDDVIHLPIGLDRVDCERQEEEEEEVPFTYRTPSRLTARLTDGSITHRFYFCWKNQVTIPVSHSVIRKLKTNGRLYL